MQQKYFWWSLNILSVIFMAGCAPTVINFDQFPDGSLVPSQTHAVIQGNAVSAQSLISNQYAAKGVTFSSSAPAVFAASFSPDVPSAPNVACPLQANGTAGYSEPTTINISANNICNASVTITRTSGITTMKAFNASGNQIGPAVSSHGSTSRRAGVRETLHINACDIDKVVLTGTNYCFDDLKFSR